MSDLLEKCTTCGGLLDEEDLFCANCGTEAPLHPSAKRPNTKTSTHNFRCEGCGAAMSYSASAQSLACPFCGSVELAAEQDAKVLSASRVVPVVLDQAQAIEVMRTTLNRGFWRPSDLSEQAAVVEMQLVYVPYWVFTADTHTHWTADTDRTPTRARGDWFPMTGEHRNVHQGLLVGASGVLTTSETNAICPFDLERAVVPEEVDLDDATIEQFSVPRKYARPLARHGLESQEALDCQQQYVPGRCRNMNVNVRISNMTSEPVLLPVWIMAYRYREQVYRFLVNGQTSKASGRAPQSLTKIGMAIGGGVLALVLLFLLCAGLLSLR